jgi:hypothetical protein
MRWSLIILASLFAAQMGCGGTEKSAPGHSYDTQSRMFFINTCSAVSDPVKRRNTEYMMVKRKLCTCVMERIESTMSFGDYEKSVLDKSLMDHPKVVEAFDGCTSSQRQQHFGRNVHSECMKQLEGAGWPEESKEKLCTCVSEKTKGVISAHEVAEEAQFVSILLESTQACSEEFPELINQIQRAPQPPSQPPSTVVE